MRKFGVLNFHRIGCNLTSAAQFMTKNILDNFHGLMKTLSEKTPFISSYSGILLYSSDFHSNLNFRYYLCTHIGIAKSKQIGAPGFFKNKSVNNKDPSNKSTSWQLALFWHIVQRLFLLLLKNNPSKNTRFPPQFAFPIWSPFLPYW